MPAHALSLLWALLRGFRKHWGQLCVRSLSTQDQPFPTIGSPANLLAPAKLFFWRQCATRHESS